MVIACRIRAAGIVSTCKAVGNGTTAPRLWRRGWLRIPENSQKDDNPDISDYVGRADLVARWEPSDKSQAVSILFRNNLRFPQNRGFVQFDWAMPVAFGQCGTAARANQLRLW